jgi:hypothetical protein
MTRHFKLQVIIGEKRARRKNFERDFALWQTKDAPPEHIIALSTRSRTTRTGKRNMNCGSNFTKI